MMPVARSSFVMCTLCCVLDRILYRACDSSSTGGPVRWFQPVPQSVPVDVGESELPAANDVPSECMTEPITDELCLIVGSISATPSTDNSESHKVAFKELTPLPKRERHVGKKARKKPPSYELTDTATIQLVSVSIQKNAKPRPKIKRKKEQSLLAVTPKKQKVKPKKQKVKANGKKKANGIYISAGCNARPKQRHGKSVMESIVEDVTS